MSIMTSVYTRAQYDLLPEGFPAQLIEGQLLREPSPDFGHQRIAFSIARTLEPLVGPRRVCLAPLDVPVDEFNVYQPDIVVFRVPLEDETETAARGVPLLVIEVLSPSTASRDRLVKRTRLLDAGVEEVWLVDRMNGSIDVYDLGSYRDVPRRSTRNRPIASGVLPGFELTPAHLFAARHL
jgi:Uma2 family endonuclease